MRVLLRVLGGPIQADVGSSTKKLFVLTVTYKGRAEKNPEQKKLKLCINGCFLVLLSSDVSLQVVIKKERDDL